MVEVEELAFPSRDGATEIHALLWRDGAPREPRGIVQVVHGMAEHIGRYDAFARYLAQRGYAVCGHDHIGHGASVASKEDWGHIPLSAGADALVEDAHELRCCVQPCFDRATPYFLFGHSMGSFVVRNCIAEHGEGLAGAIICGTGHVPGAMARGGNLLARAIARMRGERHVSPLLGKLTVGAYADAVENPRTPLDWLSYDEANVDRYIEDEACGFPFTAAANAALTDLTLRLADGTWAQRVPHDLPLLFVSGAEDPVGDNGAGVRAAHAHTVDAGMADTQVKLYEGMRHEILNEADGEQVMQDILEWMEDHM